MGFLAQLRRKQTAKAGWTFFVQQFSGLILQTIREAESDYDQIQDRYLYVCQQLAARDFKRLLGFKEGGQRGFAAWLRAVTRNLCIDYLREQEGRRRLPRGVARLPALDQEVFEAAYWQGYNATETYENVRTSHPGLRFAQVLESLERIRAALQPWQVQKVLDQKLPAPVSPVGPEGESLLEQVPDGRASPEEDILLQEKSRLLEKAVAELPEPARLLLRLRFELGLTLQEIARLSGRADHRKVHEELARILEQLEGRLKGRGWSQ